MELERAVCWPSSLGLTSEIWLVPACLPGSGHAEKHYTRGIAADDGHNRVYLYFSCIDYRSTMACFCNRGPPQPNFMESGAGPSMQVIPQSRGGGGHGEFTSQFPSVGQYTCTYIHIDTAMICRYRKARPGQPSPAPTRRPPGLHVRTLEMITVDSQDRVDVSYLTG